MDMFGNRNCDFIHAAECKALLWAFMPIVSSPDWGPCTVRSDRNLHTNVATILLKIMLVAEDVCSVLFRSPQVV